MSFITKALSRERATGQLAGDHGWSASGSSMGGLPVWARCAPLDELLWRMEGELEHFDRR